MKVIHSKQEKKEWKAKEVGKSKTTKILGLCIHVCKCIHIKIHKYLSRGGKKKKKKRY